MRKKALLMITCAAFMLITGCSSNPLADTTPTTTTNSTTESAPASTEAPAPTETPAPEETTISLGKKGTVGNWEINAKSVSVKQKIKNGTYQYFKPGKGNSFVVISMSAKNK